MKTAIHRELERLHDNNPRVSAMQAIAPAEGRRLGRVLVANRGEIAKRFFFALREEGIASVAVVADPDRGQSWYEFADQVIYIGGATRYTCIETITSAALLSHAHAIYPGYGFLSENMEFARTLEELQEGPFFMGPPSLVMERVSNKLDARKLALEHGVPLFQGSSILRDIESARGEADRIGYPVMVKLDAGGGGKGMVAVHSSEELGVAVESALRIGRASYDNSDFYLEKLIERPVHMEVQIFNGTAVGIRKCAVQRRNQKIIEETGDFFLDNGAVLKLLAAAETMAKVSGYADGAGAGTVEFLFDAAAGEFGFLEINTRLQVEYPVTDQSLDIDLARWQILHFDNRQSEIPYEHALRKRFTTKRHAVECRIYAEDPWNNFAPAPGRITVLDPPTFNGVRCDFGFMAHDEIVPDYDPMMGKLIAYGDERSEALLRLERALGELYVGGITTNVDQLLKIVRHPAFVSGEYTNRLLEDAPELNLPETDCDNPLDAAVFACLAEFQNYVNRTMEHCFATEDLENVVRGDMEESIPRGFEVLVLEKSYLVHLTQTSTDTCRVFVNGAHMGTARIRSRGAERYHILYHERAYPIRLDRRAGFVALRVLEGDGRMHYYRLKIDALGVGREKDAPGMLRCPFQGSFVGFATNGTGESPRIGDQVEAGAPLMIISAMKMETTLSAPIAGTLTYLIEDGVAERLVQSRTEQGLIIGRSLSEGEALFTVAAGNDETAIVREPTEAREPMELTGLLLEADRDEKEIEGSIRSFVAREPESVFRLLRHYFLGYVSGETIEARLYTALEAMSEIPDSGETEAPVVDVLEIYSHLKQIYSPVLGRNQTWFGEMNRMLRNWDDETYRPPYFFRSVMANLLARYGVGDEGGGKRSHEKRSAFFHVMRAYGAANKGTRFIPPLLRMLRRLSEPGPGTVKVLRRLERSESGEQDDGIAREVRELLRAWSTLRSGAGTRTSPRSGDLPEAGRETMPSWARERADELMGIVARKHAVKRLPSPYEDVLLYESAELETGAKRVDCIACLPAGYLHPARNEKNEVVDLPEVHAIAGRTAAAIRSSRLPVSEVELYVTVLAANKTTLIDPGGNDPRILNRSRLGSMLGSSLKHYRGIPATLVLVELFAESPGAAAERRYLSVYIESGQAAFDWIFENDKNHPFWNETDDPRTQKLFDRKKWPVEIWARETFDPGSVEELTIPSIDRIPDPRASGFLQVGARIYRGTMRGLPAYFFMKDSRKKGGATGDLEGRKYMAAAYLAYMHDEPLYIWNDGAGANIREGMIALNRAGQGFMFNALTSARMPYGEFLSRLSRTHDSRSHDLMQELDELFNVTHHGDDEKPKRYFLTAVGIGSSTGLDVYGSSQATLQVMLDSRESYRVLTGASVIKAVTGEDLTNYEIGGARVMGHGTGTADVIAADKLELIHQLRRIHEMVPGGSPRGNSNPREFPRAHGVVLLDERTIRAASDDGEFLALKKEHQEAGALLGGLTRLGGRAALVMGPRTDAGIRSFACAVKARELLRIADRLELSRVLVFAQRWYRGDGGSENELQARMEFMRTLNGGRGPRIHIIKGIAGLRRVSLNSGADVLIFTPQGDENSRDLDFARATADLMAADAEEAFALATRVLRLMNCADARVSHGASADTEAGANGEIVLPAEASRPFDMKKDVLRRLVDHDSLLVFRDGGEGPSGEPNLVTALASLHGRTVGIIADQPLHGGAPDAPGTEKFRRFMQFLEKNRIPLLMISNAPGFVPGTKQERLRIQQIGGESLDVNVLSTVPVVSVVLKQNFGGRQIHAFSKYLRPGITAIAPREATMAVMGAGASFDLFKKAEFEGLLKQGRGREADELRDEYLRAFNAKARADQDALSTGALDWTLDSVSNLREHVVRALRIASDNSPQK